LWLTWPTASSNFETKHTVDGQNPAVAPVELGSLSRYLQGFMHPTGICLESLSSTDHTNLDDLYESDVIRSHPKKGRKKITEFPLF